MTAPDGSAARAGAVPVRIVVPHQLRQLAGVSGEIVVHVDGPLTVSAVIDAVERAHPALAGTIRDRSTGRRRSMIRIYADGDDYSDDWTGSELPTAVRDGREPLRLVGAIAGG